MGGEVVLDCQSGRGRRINMGFDICFIKENGEGWEQDGDEGERIAGVPDFLNMAQVMSSLLDMIHGLRDPQFNEHLDRFWEANDEDRAGKVARFDSYCEFVNEAFRQVGAFSAETQALIGPVEPVRADDFADEVKAFLGAYFLSGQPLTADFYSLAAPFIGANLGLMSYFAEEMSQKGQTEQSAALKDAYRCLDSFRRFGDQAMAENRVFYVDA